MCLASANRESSLLLNYCHESDSDANLESDDPNVSGDFSMSENHLSLNYLALHEDAIDQRESNAAGPRLARSSSELSGNLQKK